MRQWLLGGVARRSSGSDLSLGVRRITGSESSVATPHGITLSTGELAHLADGAVYAQFGRTTALCTTVSSRSPVEHSKASFVPLTIEYREKQSAVGRIPPTFNRREGRQQDREVLSSRLIDRAVRPLFPSGYAFETQVVANVLSSDGETDPDILCINAASAALSVSDIPWHGPIGAVRVAMAHDGSLTTNPSASTADSSLLSLVYAGTEDKPLMLEAQGSGSGASNSAFAEALRFARRRVAEMIQPQRRFAASAGKQKRRCTLHGIPSRTLSDEASSRLLEPAKAVLRKGRSFDGKIERHAALHEVQNKVISELQTEGFGTPAELDTATSDVTRRAIRDVTHDEDVRPDGRSLQELRTIKCRASVLPRVHGSSIFQRGDTQLLATTTLGSLNDAQKLTGLTGPATKRTMVSYSFPGFCVNEVRSTGNVSRREIGHGALAERGLQPIIPNESDLPFSIRLSTDVLSSNGSSSMGAVCAGSLALMDAGVPIPEHVAGVSVGLSMDHDVNGSLRRYVLPVDIQGVEDALGDMDFKVAGTRKGVTALQLDCKPAGIPLEILIEALDVAQSAREKIISFMDRAISQPHSSMSTNAPRFGSLQLPSNKLGAIIGPGGSTIKEIESLYDTKVNVNDSNGTVSVFAPNKEAYDNTIAHMYNLTAERKNSNSKAVEVGETVPCRVEEIRNFGAIVQCVRSGERGLLHVSQIAHERVQNIQDFISPQDELEMECLERTDRGVRFSRKRLLPEPEKHQNDAESQEQKRRSRR